MTPKQLIAHYGDERLAALRLDYHPYTIKKWIAADAIPRKAQQLIERVTAGKLKADRKYRLEDDK